MSRFWRNALIAFGVVMAIIFVAAVFSFSPA